MSVHLPKITLDTFPSKNFQVPIFGNSPNESVDSLGVQTIELHSPHGKEPISWFLETQVINNPSL